METHRERPATVRGRQRPRRISPLAAGVLALSCALAFACATRKSDSPAPSYPRARVVDRTKIVFDDGDTFVLAGKPIRVIGIDAPEIAHPDLGFPEPQPYGIAAAETTRALITRARLVEYVPDGLDRYDRRLAHVFVDGELLAIRLIEMGLAYETVSHFGDSGFPDLAQRILDAARAAPKPPFEEPYKWKRRQRRAR